MAYPIQPLDRRSIEQRIDDIVSRHRAARRWNLDRIPTEAELFADAGVTAADIPPEKAEGAT